MIKILEIIENNKDNLKEVEFTFDFSKATSEKLEYNLFGVSLILEIYQSLSTPWLLSEEECFSPSIRLNAYRKNGEKLIMGVPLLNYTDFLLPLRGLEEFEDIYLTCLPVSKLGFLGATPDTLGTDVKVVTFKDEKSS